jgi:hypothetical protein
MIEALQLADDPLFSSIKVGASWAFKPAEFTFPPFIKLYFHQKLSYYSASRRADCQLLSSSTV